MDSIKIYNKENKILFHKNKLLCFIYKYEIENYIMYSINMSQSPSKFHSIFEYVGSNKYQDVRISITENCIDYEIKYKNFDLEIRENEKGRIPLLTKKKKWSKKTSILKDGDKISVETFDGSRSVVYKMKEELINKLLKTNKNGNRK